MEKENDKLKKIVNMYKNGTEFEKRNAGDILKKICLKYNLDMNDLLDVSTVKEFEFKFWKKLPLELAAQIFFKVVGGKLRHSKYDLYFECSTEKYFEFETAFSVYCEAYKTQRKEMLQRHRKERNVFSKAFIMRHEIYSNKTNEDSEERKKRARKLSEKFLDDMRFAMDMAGNIKDDVFINKQLT